MGQVVIIEDQSRHLKAIKDVIGQIDATLEVLSFESMHDFYESFKVAVEALSKIKKIDKKDKGAKNKDGDSDSGPQIKMSDLKVLIVDQGLSKKIPLDLWSKVTKTINKQHADGSKVRLIMTAHDDFDSQDEYFHYADLVLFTLLIKPFDTTLLRQFLLIALTAGDKLQVGELYNYETDQVIDMVKRVNVELLTELGFRTQNKRPIEEGKVARYKGSVFGANEDQTVFAYCYANFKRNEEDYVCSFSYFGISNERLHAVRRAILKDKSAIVHQFPAGVPGSINYKVAVLSDDENILTSIENVLSEKFEGIQVLTKKDLSGFETEQESSENAVDAKDVPQAGKSSSAQTDTNQPRDRDIDKLDPIGVGPENGGACQEIKRKSVLAVFTDEPKLLDLIREKFTSSVSEKLYVILLSKQAVENYATAAKVEGFDDVLCVPLDRYYVTRKMKMYFPMLRFKKQEDNSRNGIELSDHLRVGVPLKLKSVSEVHLTFSYHRPLKPGDVRTFSFKFPEQKDEPEVFGVCKAASEVEKGQFVCEFLFFGMTDRHCRHIRQWILHNFRENKKKEQKG